MKKLIKTVFLLFTFYFLNSTGFFADFEDKKHIDLTKVKFIKSSGRLYSGLFGKNWLDKDSIRYVRPFRKLNFTLPRELTLLEIRPRIFTPNGDEWNEVVSLHFGNPYDKSDISAKIFDIKGRFVCNLNVKYTPGYADTFWDGRNENGNIVHSGVYIYQIETGREVITGTIMVVK